MTDTDIDYNAAWAALAAPQTEEAPAPRAADLGHRLVQPLADAADDFVRWCQAPQERVYTGMAELDAEMRGTAPGEMTMWLGFSHSGKTLALTQALICNRNKRVLFFQPDEPRVLTLVKLACAYHGVDARELESRIASDDKEAKNLLRETATIVFPKLIVIDKPLITANMDRGVREASEVWGYAPELVVVDFLELIEDIEMVPAKATWLKGFGRNHDVPMWVLHQLSRTKGADGQVVGIDSGAYGGETQATHLIGVRRKRSEILAKLKALREKQQSEKTDEQIADLEYMLGIHEYTVSVNLVKNKRPGGDLLPEVDFELFKKTGQLKPLEKNEMPRQWRAINQRTNRYIQHDRAAEEAAREWEQQEF